MYFVDFICMIEKDFVSLWGNYVTSSGIGVCLVPTLKTNVQFKTEDKMENKSKNLVQNPPFCKTDVKYRFFAQYWGFKCMYVGGAGLVEIGTGGWNLKHPDFFLQLKTLSKITDEDAKEIIRIENFIGVFEEIIIEDTFLELLIDIKKGRCNRFSVIDFLRSKCYAIPFMEYSVEDLVSFGWVRLV